MKSAIKVLITVFIIALPASSCNKSIRTDILIAGGGTGGIAAGIQAARSGAETVIIEEHEWLGGMLTAAGVSAADGNYRLRGGIWKEFTDSLCAYYGGENALKTGWVSNIMFEPHIGDRIFKNMAAAEPNLKIIYKTLIEKVEKTDREWKVTVMRGNERFLFKSKILIDATELGDVAAKCGVEYDIGMDSREVTGEKIAPERENDIVQDLTYVAVLKDYGRDVTVPEPQGYDPALFACCCANALCKNHGGSERLWPCESMISYGRLPNNKYMINWPISGNDYYVNLTEMSLEERAGALQKAKDRTMAFIYFIQHELGMNTLGLADDEFPTSDLLPFIPYIRESRRIKGRVRFTLNHITDPYDQPDKLYRTAIAAGDYPVDHHHTRYSGEDPLPDLRFPPIPSYGLPMGVMLPSETKALLVIEKSISVTNLVNGTTRLQPVVMQTGQAAGVIAALSVRNETDPGEVQVRQVQQELLDAGGYLLPYLDVPCEHPWFKPVQRIGVTGIMKGEGKSSGWSNQTFFRAFDTLLWSDLTGLNDYYPEVEHSHENEPVNLGDALKLIRTVATRHSINLAEEELKHSLRLISDGNAYDSARVIMRGEMAVLTDALIDPFSRDIDIKGQLK